MFLFADWGQNDKPRLLSMQLIPSSLFFPLFQVRATLENGPKRIKYPGQRDADAENKQLLERGKQLRESLGGRVPLQPHPQAWWQAA